MPEVLREYIDGEYKVIEYTKDGETVSNRIEFIIPDKPYIQPPSSTEQILAETQYQTALMEMNAMGGM